MSASEVSLVDAAPVPLVLLTGFLGAGKTTVLNRVLAREHHVRIGVIVNELGRVDVDGKLLKARAGDVIELLGGCVCHQVRTQAELWSGIDETIARARPDVIVLETTGIAEPDAILAALADVPSERRKVFCAGVVTVVGVDAILDQVDQHAEARLQVKAADRLLLTKLDLVGPDELLAVHRTLERLNPEAERASFPRSDEGTSELVPWLLDVRRRRPGDVSAPSEAGGHAHSHQLVAVGISMDPPLLIEPLLQLCGRLGPRLVRAKGFVNVAGEPRRGFLERAGASPVEVRWDEWPPGPRRTELVLIGEGLDAAALRRQIWCCRVEGGHDETTAPTGDDDTPEASSS